MPASPEIVLQQEGRAFRVVRLPALDPDLHALIREYIHQSRLPEERFWRFLREVQERGARVRILGDRERILQAMRERFQVQLVGRGRGVACVLSPQAHPEILKAVNQYTRSDGWIASFRDLRRLLTALEKAGALVQADAEAQKRIHDWKQKNRIRVVANGSGLRVEHHPSLRRALRRLLELYGVREGRLEEPLFLRALARVVPQEGGILEDEPARAAYHEIARKRVALVVSRQLYHRIRVLYDPTFLPMEWQEVIQAYAEPEYGIVEDLEQVPQLVERLRALGAQVAVEPAVERILATHARIARGDLGDLPLKRPLYPYQRIGAAFLAHTGRALLADEMGLGKTVQALAAFLFLREQGLAERALVFCPASLKHQWAEETVRFTPLRPVVIIGNPEERRQRYHTEGDLYIVNYELLLRDVLEIQRLAGEVIILDEAQRIKNHRAKTVQILRSLPARFVFALTGTPLENQPMELYNILRFVNPEVLGTNVLKFQRRYVVTDRFGRVRGVRRPDELRKRIGAVILRRTKREVASQLPPRLENTYRVDLTVEQRTLYRQYERELREFLRYATGKKDEVLRALGLLTYLREIADSTELLEEDTRASAKIPELRAILEEFIPTNQKILIFSEFERMTRILERELAEYGVLRFYGALTQKKRQEVLTRFREDPEVRLLISTDAGSQGLNLQVATVVIHFDLPFNPARLEQRIGRAHRLGQREPVNVIYLVAQGTVEMGILRLLERKRRMFEQVVEGLETKELLQRAPRALDLLREILRASEGLF